MRVELVSPERVIWEGEASMVVTRTMEGEIAFQPGHAPFIGVLVEHHARIHLPDGTVRSAAVHRGFVEVGPGKVTILSDIAEMADEIDVERARRAKEAAEIALRHEHDAEVVSALARANARLGAAGALIAGH